MSITNPTSLAGLLGWWDASQLGLANGANVTSFTDFSGNTRPLNSVSATNPTYQTNIQNGLGIVRFITANSTFIGRTSGNSSVFRTTDWSWWLCAIPRALTNISGYATMNPITAGNIAGWYTAQGNGITTGYGNMQTRVGSSTSHTVNNDVPRAGLIQDEIFILGWDHVESTGVNRIWWNGILSTTFTQQLGTWSTTGLYLGRQWSDSSNYGQFDCCEFFGYNQVFSWETNYAIARYLSDKWKAGILWNRNRDFTVHQNVTAAIPSPATAISSLAVAIGGTPTLQVLVQTSSNQPVALGGTAGTTVIVGVTTSLAVALGSSATGAVETHGASVLAVILGGTVTADATVTAASVLAVLVDGTAAARVSIEALSVLAVEIGGQAAGRPGGRPGPLPYWAHYTRVDHSAAVTPFPEQWVIVADPVQLAAVVPEPLRWAYVTALAQFVDMVQLGVPE